MNEREKLLNILDFGELDAKKDEFLREWFISTEEFKKFFEAKYNLILGGKGSGKSAIFNLMIKYKETAENLYGKRLDNVLILPAFGIETDDEINFEQMREIDPKDHKDFLYLWKLYVALRIGKFVVSELPKIVDISLQEGGLEGRFRKLLRKPKKDESFVEILRYMRKLGIVKNGRPLKNLSDWLKEYLGVKFGAKAKGIEISVIDDEIMELTKVDVTKLLKIEDSLLGKVGKEIWVLMDELDYFYSRDLKIRKIYFEALMEFLLFFVERFPNIKLKIFLRTDIYNVLQITNKSHLEGGKLTLRWNEENLMILLMTRVLHYRELRDFLKSRNVTLPSDIRKLSSDKAKEIFYAIFDQQVKSGKKEAKFSHMWILKRITDGRGEMFPREFIHYGNTSVLKQKELIQATGEIRTEKLISGKAIENSLKEISAYRVDTYLNSEFPHLKPHIDKLRGSSTKKFSRNELLERFENLTPAGDEAIEQVYETGALRIKDKKPIDSAQEFEIPPLYITGLGITVRGRK